MLRLLGGVDGESVASAPVGPLSANLALRNGHFVHQNDGSKIGKPNRSFLDPIFDVETDSSLQFGLRARPGGHFSIGNYFRNGGSTKIPGLS